MTENLQTIQETPCLFCPNTVRYVIDFSISITADRPETELAAIGRGPMKSSAKV
jgi:hypothetical protein